MIFVTTVIFERSKEKIVNYTNINVDKEISKALGRLFFEFKKLFNHLWSKYDITAEQASILYILYDEDNLNINEIAKRSIKDAPSTTRLIKRLKEKNFVFCKVDKTDKRVINVCLTPNGEKLRSVAKDILTYNQKIYEGIENEEKCNFYNILKRMAENIEKMEKKNKKSK